MLCYACCVRHLGFGSLQPNRVSLPILEVSTNMRLYGICSASPLLSSGAALSSGSAEQHIAFASPTVIGISGRGCCRQEITLHKWWSVHDGVVPLCRSWTVLKMTLVWSMMRRGINGFGVVACADIRQHHRSRSMADKFDNQTFENYKKENGGSIFDVSISVASLITLFVSVSVCHFGFFCARLVICYPPKRNIEQFGSLLSAQLFGLVYDLVLFLFFFLPNSAALLFIVTRDCFFDSPYFCPSESKPIVVGQVLCNRGIKHRLMHQFLTLDRIRKWSKAYFCDIYGYDTMLLRRYEELALGWHEVLLGTLKDSLCTSKHARQVERAPLHLATASHVVHRRAV